MPVHLRLNDKDTTRNPFINFVTALPGARHDEALRRLQQLAAMVKPLMKEQGFHINSLEEYEWNREFAGRCWNNGEVVELVLTSASGEWMPLQYVLFVFCHELAHIKHMNHIPRLHGALTRHLKELAVQKQRQGYFGDGLYSDGRRLQGGDSVKGLGMQNSSANLPEHVCGGAFSRTPQAAAARRRRLAHGRRNGGRSARRKYKGPSLHTGAQTAPNAGGGSRRVQLDVGAPQGGKSGRVDGRDFLPVATARDATYKLDANSTFRKRTQSKEAREMRASAALARFAHPAATRPEGSKVHCETTRDVPIKEEGIFRQTFGVKRPVASGSKVVEVLGFDSGSDLDESGSEGESVTEDDEIDCGNAEGDEGEEEAQYTQGWNETAEQRQKRMRRFRDRDAAETNENAEGGNELNGEGDDWAILLEELPSPPPTALPTAPPLTSTTQSSLKRPSGMSDDDDDDDVVLVEHRPPKKVLSSGHTAASSASSVEWRAASQSTHQMPQWTCLVCTLVNNGARKHCEACDMAHGKTALRP